MKTAGETGFLGFPEIGRIPLGPGKEPPEGETLRYPLSSAKGRCPGPPPSPGRPIPLHALPALRGSAVPLDGFQEIFHPWDIRPSLYPGSAVPWPQATLEHMIQVAVSHPDRETLPEQRAHLFSDGHRTMDPSRASDAHR